MSFNLRITTKLWSFRGTPMIVRLNHKNSQQHKKLMLQLRTFVSKRHLSFIQKYPFLPNCFNSRHMKLVPSLEFTTTITNPTNVTTTSTRNLTSNSTPTSASTTHGALTDKIQAHAWKKIEMTPSGERIFHLDPLPMVNKDVYHHNTETTAEWLFHTITNSSTATTTMTTSNRSHESNNIILYIGFEAFYHMSFDRLGEELKTKYPDSILVFSPLVKSTREYIQNKSKYNDMESTVLTASDWDKRTIVHLGASHAMDKVIFDEDAEGHLQKAWKEGRLILFTPELAVVDEYVYRANLYQILHTLLVKLTTMSTGNPLNDTLPTIEKHCDIKRVIPCDYDLLDQDILETKQRVTEAQSMDEAFAEVYTLLSTYISREQLDCICYFDSGSESFRLYKSVSKLLDSKDMKIPWTRTGLIHARNAAIGDALHTFYATAPEAFPFIVTGDTAALLAGGISMINMHSHNRFGVVVVLNNRGMAIEDVISKRSVDGHQFQYEYVKLDRKRDIFSLDQLKSVIDKDVLSALRDHLWGVSANRAKAIVLNIDVQSLAKETSRNVPSDIISMKGSYLDDDFGVRYVQLKEPRTRLEEIIDVLYEELNEASARSIGSDCHHTSAKVPVKVVGCSAIEYMEVVSQLSMTSRQKLQFLPKPTDLLATRTLLPSLVESTRRTVSAAFGASNFINSNYTFSVFISNAVFGLDGLNNLISTHLEYGTGTLIHLAYDAAEVVSHYSLIGQVHRNFGIRPSEILPSLYRNHQMYDGQILVIRNSSSDAEKNVADVIRDAIRNPDIKVILMDMGAPNLTESLK